MKRSAPAAMIDAATPTATVCPPGDWKTSLRRRLLAWYRRQARDLPWRRSRDPYGVWVSEIMLQQTQVATVAPYFLRFLAAWPTVAALAAADERDVLRLWEGLGYYRRARQLHRAARVIAAEHAGQFPNQAEAVRRLPGIGRYTAGAILSIAFDQRQPILEANTVRLLSRLLAYRGDPAQKAGQRLLWQAAEELLPARNAGDFNQALMELGSQVCTPRNPKCATCPLVSLCPTAIHGWQDSIPLAKRRPEIEQVREASVVVTHRRKVLLIERGASERWAGMWDFVRFPLASEPGEPEQFLAREVRQRTGVAIGSPRHLTTLRHGVTRFRITLECYAAEKLPGRTRSAQATTHWVSPADFEQYPLSVTARKLARLVQQM